MYHGPSDILRYCDKITFLAEFILNNEDSEKYRVVEEHCLVVR